MGRVKMAECVGGPLCGRRHPRLSFHRKFYCIDDKGVPHFYRLIRVIANDSKSAAIYYCYFGSDRERALKVGPLRRPGDNLFKPLSKSP